MERADPEVPRALSETVEVFCIGPYGTTIKEHRNFTKANIEKLKKYWKNYTKEKMTTEFQRLNISEERAARAAEDIIGKGKKLWPNDAGAGAQSKVTSLQARYFSQNNEMILMLAFPLKRMVEDPNSPPPEKPARPSSDMNAQRPKMVSHDDAKQRDEENRDYIKTYLGDEDDSRVKYVQVQSYRHRYCCLCTGIFEQVTRLPSQTAEYFMDKYDQGQTTPGEEQDPGCMAKQIHPFLHEICENTLLAQIVYNGHGSKEGLLVHEDGPVKLDDIIEDVTKCFRTIPRDVPPVQIDIIFPQCYGNMYTGAKSPCERLVKDPDIPPEYPAHPSNGMSVESDKTITVTHLVLDELTVSLPGYHLQLQEYADERKKMVKNIPEVTPAADIPTRSTETTPAAEQPVTGEAEDSGPGPLIAESTSN